MLILCMLFNFGIAVEGCITNITQFIFHLQVDSLDVAVECRSLTECLFALLAHQILQFPVDSFYVVLKLRLFL